LERKEQIAKWKVYAKIDIEADETIINLANSINHLGLKKFDSLHIACAIKANADYFLTTDVGIIKKANLIQAINIKDPIDFIRELLA